MQKEREEGAKMAALYCYTLAGGETGTCHELYTQLTAGLENPIAFQTFRSRLDYGWRDAAGLIKPLQNRFDISQKDALENKETYHLDDGFTGSLTACVKHFRGRGWKLPPEKIIRDRLFNGITGIDKLRALHLSGEVPLPQKLLDSPTHPRNRNKIKNKIVMQGQSFEDTLHCRNPLPKSDDWIGWNPTYIRPGALDGYPELKKMLKVPS